MKITKVDVFMKKGNVSASEVGCRIYTNEGIYGDGEGAIAYGTGSTATFGMIKDLSKLIIGMDPLQNEVIWDKLYKATFWGQNGGPIVFAGISAIDFALWDIKGKFFNVPIYVLLGGKFRDNLRCYASQLQFGWGPAWDPQCTPDDYRNITKKAVAEGYDCVKVDFFQTRPNAKEIKGEVVTGSPIMFSAEDTTRLRSPLEVKMVEDRIAATREGAGPNVDIIMENHSMPDANSAVQLARVAEKYNIFYYEEPNTPSPLTAKYLSEKINIPISQGERVYSRWQYAQFFEQMSVQVIQPDLGNTGGLTEGKKICDMAYVYDVSVQAHVCAGPLSTAVALHLECAIPNFQIHEHHVRCLPESHRKLCKYDYQPENGRYKVPELPGIGNEWSDFIFKEWEVVTVQ